MEIGHVRADLHEQLLGLLQLVGLATVGGVAQVMQRCRQHLGRRVEESDTAGLQLLDVLGFEHQDRKSTRLNSSHVKTSYAVFCLKKKKEHKSGLQSRE